MAFDFPFVVRSEDQKHVFAFLQRASEAHDPLGLQRTRVVRGPRQGRYQSWRRLEIAGVSL